MSYQDKLVQRFGADRLLRAARRSYGMRAKGSWKAIRALNIYELVASKS